MPKVHDLVDIKKGIMELREYLKQIRKCLNHLKDQTKEQTEKRNYQNIKQRKMNGVIQKFTDEAAKMIQHIDFNDL